MRPTWIRSTLAGALALAGLLELTATPARAQFALFSGGTVLQPNGRKLGIPPGSPIRQSDYPPGTIGYAPTPAGNYPGGRAYARRYARAAPVYRAPAPVYATAPRTYYVPGRGYFYYPQAVPRR